MKNKEYKEELPNWRKDNIYTFIGLAITIGGIWASMVGDVREIKKDVAYMKDIQEKNYKIQEENYKLLLERYVSLENRYGDLALKVKGLETLLIK